MVRFLWKQAFVPAPAGAAWTRLWVLLVLLGLPACGRTQTGRPMLPESPQAGTGCLSCLRETHLVPAAAAGEWAGSMPQNDQGDSETTKAGDKKPQQKGGKYSPSANAGSPGHIFWVVPAFKVNYGKGYKPLSPHEKFQEWAESVYDPLGLAAGGVEAATLEYSSSDGFCGYGHGWAGYGKCYGSMQLDATDSSFIGDYLLTVWLHQDPRYFRLGTGTIARRVLYSISRVFITYDDKGHNVFYTSGLTGTTVAGIVSNAYYPQQDRGVGPTISRVGLDLGNTALYNAAAEFWPDIHGVLRRTFSRKGGGGR